MHTQLRLFFLKRKKSLIAHIFYCLSHNAHLINCLVEFLISLVKLVLLIESSFFVAAVVGDDDDGAGGGSGGS